MTAKITGFTPLMDEIVEKYRGEGLLQALLYSAIYGRIWRYSQQSKKRCTASQARIANDLDIGRTVVNRACKRMVKDKLLEEVSNVKGFPVEYTTRRGIDIEIALDVEKEKQDTCSTVEQDQTDKSEGCSTVEQGVFNSKTGGVQLLNIKKEEGKNKKENAPKNGAGGASNSPEQTSTDKKEKDSTKKKKALDFQPGSLEFLPSTVRPLGLAFLEEAGAGYAPIQADIGLWRKVLNEWAARGFTVDIVKLAIRDMRKSKLTISGPQSITKVGCSIKGGLAKDNTRIYHAGDMDRELKELG